MDVLSIIGTAASIGGLGFGIYERSRRIRSQRREQVEIWGALASVRKANIWLHETQKGEASQDVTKAYALNATTYRRLIERAVLLEKDFDAETIEKWLKQGKLQRGWEEEQARMLLP